ncbi:MAG: MBOAT family protein [Desulfobulbus sp.]|nr:MBOAT family protein [Desulfobulbus sp.]
MVFSSITFLFFFLPAVLLLNGCSRGRGSNVLLLVASLLFYAWGEGIYLLVMLASILGNFAAGLLIDRFRRTTAGRAALGLGVGLNLVLLGFFKYATFLVDNLNQFLALVGLPGVALGPVHLPIGISFFTFQAISYLMDLHRGTVRAQRNLIDLGLYIALFPQLIAGPIVRYHDIAAEIVRRRVTSIDFAVGAERFIYGLAKKVLLANPLGLVADKIFALPVAELSPALCWLGALCYTFQIYYDFSGYSDMAIGLGRMFGFHFLENFNYPYIAASIRDFWRRWHISLSNWLRDYVYIPLGGNRGGAVRTAANLWTVFFLCGLWHGAAWTFVAWGLFHGFFLVVERSPLGQLLDRLWLPLRHLLTLVVVMAGWVLFRSETLAEALAFLGIMAGFDPVPGGRYPVAMYLDRKTLVELALAACLSLPLFPLLRRRGREIIDGFGRPWQNGLAAGAEAGRLALLGTLVYCTWISLAAGVYNPFIYFRF